MKLRYLWTRLFKSRRVIDLGLLKRTEEKGFKPFFLYSSPHKRIDLIKLEKVNLDLK